MAVPNRTWREIIEITAHNRSKRVYDRTGFASLDEQFPSEWIDDVASRAQCLMPWGESAAFDGAERMIKERESGLDFWAGVCI